MVVHCEPPLASEHLRSCPGVLHILPTGAANRFPDKCDADPENARTTNVDASRALALACARQGILIIYMSTDYVFPGRPGEAPYEADAKPAPTNIYGQTKLDGESATLEATHGTGLGVVLRVPVLYGKAKEPKESAVNVLMDVLWKSQEKDATIKMDDWAQRYPTNTEDVARICLDVSTKYLGALGTQEQLPKVLHFSSEDRLTKYEICQLFAEIMGLPMDGIVADKQGPDPGASVQRPMDTHLSTRVLQDIGIDVRTQGFKAWWSVTIRIPYAAAHLITGDGKSRLYEHSSWTRQRVIYYSLVYVVLSRFYTESMTRILDSNLCPAT